MTRLMLLLLFTQLTGTLFAQGWEIDNYKNWDHTNFRQCSLFEQKFDTAHPDYLLLDAAIFFMTNEIRMNHRLPIMQYQKLIEIAAFNHSLHMAKKNFFDHENTLESARKHPSDRGLLAGIANPHLAENIAYFPLSEAASYLDVAEHAINMWMKSPGHRSNILSDSGVEFACGVYYASEEGYFYATQDFQWFENVVKSTQPSQDRLPESL